MPTEQTKSIMHAYFEAMGRGEFKQFFTEEVTWTTIESGDVVHGPSLVQNAIIVLHSQLSDVHTRRLVEFEGAAYIEGDAIGALTGKRVSYCIAYDLHEDRIMAGRAYGPLAAMTPQS
jgi:hypothetical protein